MVCNLAHHPITCDCVPVYCFHGPLRRAPKVYFTERHLLAMAVHTNEEKSRWTITRPEFGQWELVVDRSAINKAGIAGRIGAAQKHMAGCILSFTDYVDADRRWVWQLTDQMISRHHGDDRGPLANGDLRLGVWRD